MGWWLFLPKTLCMKKWKRMLDMKWLDDIDWGKVLLVTLTISILIVSIAAVSLIVIAIKLLL